MLLLWLAGLIAGCESKEQPLRNNNEVNDLIPEGNFKTLKLENRLEEISDITYLGNGKIAGVQDEEGVIFIIDAGSGKTLSEIPFGGPGDYEGIAVHENTIFVAASNGSIIRVDHYSDKKPVISTFETGLNEYNNVEGLCYDTKKNTLLIIAKNKPGFGIDGKKYKVIYPYNMTDKVIVKEHLVKIPLEEVKRLAGASDNDKKFRFNPSGIALHPANDHYYIIASAGQLLVEMDRNGEIVSVQKLKQKIFAQPEGITFDEKGGMYISNEGGGANATLLYFKSSQINY